ncbi:MAG: hypothetical protein CMA39_02685 [Euryarchaeota archaeon]|nr:hypothetical protein [Euryarchaeota archaeon]|tara:strand:+ start:34 stop:573 length:540 start_codon:yes stop_codon:yes gene_type:complete
MVNKKENCEGSDGLSATSSCDDVSFTLDFFDSSDLAKIDLDQFHIESKVRYITYVSISLPRNWIWTKPCKTPLASFMAAENMVYARLLQDYGWEPKEFEGMWQNGFTHDIRSGLPDWFNEICRKFIGETREVIVPEGMSTRKYRKEFHKVQFNPDSLQHEHIGSVTVTSDGQSHWCSGV